MPARSRRKVALVSPNGSIVVQSGGITALAKPDPGQYILDFGTSVAGKPIIASSGRAGDPDFGGMVSAGPYGGTAERCVCPVGNDTNHIQVITNNLGETAREDPLSTSRSWVNSSFKGDGWAAEHSTPPPTGAVSL
jgi:hypothetical protein